MKTKKGTNSQLKAENGLKIRQKRVILIFPPMIQVSETEKEVLVNNLKAKAYGLWVTDVRSKYGLTSELEKVLPQKANSIPLGLLNLSGYLKKRGIEVRYIHCDYYLKAKKLTWQELLSFIEREVHDADVSGIYSTTPMIGHALQIAEAAKRGNPRGLVALGGPHVTFIDVEMIDQYSFVDVVVRGEGEETLFEVIKNSTRVLKGQVAILGTTYRANNSVNRAGDRPFIPQTEIPAPDYSILPRDFNLLLIDMYSRGCPHSCSFCAEGKIWKSRVRFRDSQTVAEELAYINREFGQTVIHIADSEIDISLSRLNDLLDAIERQQINCLFTVNLRPDAYKRLDQQTLGRMIALGFVGFFIGVESGSDYMLDRMSRKSTYAEFIRTIDLLNQLGAKIIIPYLMLGFPGETSESLQETQDKFIGLLEEERISFLFPKIFIPYPGTDPFVKPEAYSVTISRNWDEYSRFGFPPPFSSPSLTNEALAASIIDFYERIYATFKNRVHSALLTDQEDHG